MLVEATPKYKYVSILKCHILVFHTVNLMYEYIYRIWPIRMKNMNVAVSALQRMRDIRN